MKSSQDIQKEIDYVMNFAEQMGVPEDVYFQFIAVADSYLRDGDYESAEQQVDQALLAAQSYGLKPEGTMRITKTKLRRILRKVITESMNPEEGSIEDIINMCVRECERNPDADVESCVIVTGKH